MIKRMFIHTAIYSVVIALGAVAFNGGVSGGFSGGHDRHGSSWERGWDDD